MSREKIIFEGGKELSQGIFFSTFKYSFLP
jgi:hypothetical protein